MSTQRNTFRTQVGISFQYVPILVQCELLDLDYAITSLEQSARSFVSEVMKSEVVYLQNFASLSEVSAHSLAIVGKNELGADGLPFRNFECFACVLEPHMVTNFLARMFQVANHPGQRLVVVVYPSESGDL